MRSNRRHIEPTAILAIFAMSLLLISTRAAAQQEKILYNFGSGMDGAGPISGLIFDSEGNLYGTTASGGPYGNGTVFELTLNSRGFWSESRIFSPLYAGQVPCTSVVFDSGGNLYGLMQQGGVNNGGIAFELKSSAGGRWVEEVPHGFGIGSDGSLPCGGPILDGYGNLYGATSFGGTYNAGIVFELLTTADGHWIEKTLHEFGNGTDGRYPGSGLVFDAAGNIYATTLQGGALGGGTVFELVPTPKGAWHEKTLYNFSFDGQDGAYPAAGLIFDEAGNLYGTTGVGGIYGVGTVFELSPHAGGTWTEKVLHSFRNDGTDGFGPAAGLIQDRAGNLYGTTYSGGNGTFCDPTCGIVFELTASASGNWTEKILHSFSGAGTDGYSPQAGLIFDAKGNLYGTTVYGGAYGGGIGGTVFQITP